MKYAGMPMGMWMLFAGSFQKQLTAVLGYDADAAKQIAKTAKPKYKEIIAKLPAFEKGDRFQLNIIGCAMLGAFVLCMPKRPDAEALTVYYENAKMTPLMKWFCRKSGKSKFTPKDIAAMKATAALLLSGFTAETLALIIGTNLGGLGTFIASMASLISYRQIARELPQGKKQYFGLFTLSNLIFLALLLGVWFLLR